MDRKIDWSIDGWMDGWTDRQPGKEADRQILNREIDGGYIYIYTAIQ